MIDPESSFLRELQSSLPLRVASARRGVGSFLTFDLTDATGTAACRIWAYLCEWVIFEQGVPLLTASDPAREADTLPFLTERMLLAIDMDPRVPAIIFSFDEVFRLRLTSNTAVYGPFDDLVMFFRPERRVLLFAPQLGFYEAD
jgi:hypothetical protein